LKHQSEVGIGSGEASDDYRAAQKEEQDKPANCRSFCKQYPTSIPPSFLKTMVVGQNLVSLD